MIPVDLPPADAATAALVSLVETRCSVARVEVQALGVLESRLPAGGSFYWEGDPCRPRPTLRLVAIADGIETLSVTARPVLSLWEKAPLAAEAIASGEPVVLTWGEAPWGSLDGAPAQPGWVARRDLDPGELLTEHVAAPATMVLSGGTVNIVVQRGGVMLTAPGTALHDAQLGESVAVINEATKVRLDGVVRAGRLVEIP